MKGKCERIVFKTYLSEKRLCRKVFFHVWARIQIVFFRASITRLDSRNVSHSSLKIQHTFFTSWKILIFLLKRYNMRKRFSLSPRSSGRYFSLQFSCFSMAGHGSSSRTPLANVSHSMWYECCNRDESMIITGERGTTSSSNRWGFLFFIKVLTRLIYDKFDKHIHMNINNQIYLFPHIHHEYHQRGDNKRCCYHISLHTETGSNISGSFERLKQSSPRMMAT